MTTDNLTRSDISAAAEPLGWRLVLATLQTTVEVGSLAQAAEVGAAAIRACGTAADERLRVDLRPDRAELVLHAVSRRTAVAEEFLRLAGDISTAITALGLRTLPTPAGARPVQTLEVAVDALDIPAIRPFWRAVLAYGDEPGGDGPSDAVVDPAGQGPTIWFQQMDAPRPQRNRIHFDIVVPHDEADARVAAALAAGGHLVSDAEARSFWILADAEGNEVCVCTWQDRDAAGAPS